MPDEPNTDLTLLVGQMQQLLTGFAAMRDDMAAMNVTLQRVEGTLVDLVNAQVQLNRRVTALRSL